jgi:two-component system, chemotaxis family, sensor histidine kinase and response regulator PixL
MTADVQTHDWAYKRFLEEVPELLRTIEHNLLTLCTEQRNQNLQSILRATHTLKGAASTVGQETIVSVAHNFEDICQCFFPQELTISIEMFSLLLESFDRLRFFITAKLTARAIDENELLQELERLFKQLREKLGPHYRQPNYLNTSKEQNGFDLVQSIFEVGIQQRLEVLAKLLLKPGQTTEIESTLRSELELLVGLADSLELPGFSLIAQTALKALEIRPQQSLTIAKVTLDDLLQGQEQVLGGDRSRGGEPSPALLNLAQASLETTSSQMPSENIWEELDQMLEEFSKNPSEPTQEKEILALSDLSEVPSSNAAQSELTYSLKKVWEDDTLLPSELHQEQPSARPPEPIVESAPSQTVRVKLEELGHIDRTVDEIQLQHNRQLSENETLQIVVQSLLKSQHQHQQTIDSLCRWVQKLQQNPASYNEGELERELRSLAQKAFSETQTLQTAVESLEQSAKSHQQGTHKQQHLVSTLQDNLIDTRMVPLAEVLNRFTQTVRQLEIVHLKPVNLKLEGTNILVESAIAEKLYSPLLHLIRNAFDHGIEPTEVRTEQGKPEVGQLEIHAYQQGWQTVIEVKDDGQGLDFDRIKDRAVALNLFTREAASRLSIQQLSDLLFEPGFSTSSEINELSGRGIGLEAVKTEIEALGGTCTVRSQPYQGTTFSLQFPMTLTIVKLTSVKVGKIIYALLSDTIEKILLPDASKIAFSQGKKFLSYSRNSEKLLVPIYKLSELITYHSSLAKATSLETEQQTNAHSYVILLRSGLKLLGLEVEQVFGEQKTAIKPLGNAIASPSYIYGCSILDRNRLALVIDGVALIREAQVSKQNQQAVALQGLQTSSGRTLPPQKFPALAPQGQSNRPALMSLPRTILLVDDSIGQRQQTALTLQKAGYRVLQAKNGLDAIEQLQVNPQNIHLVVCDIEMPHLNGFGFLSYCRHREEWANLPVVMLANRGGKQHRKIALGLGANAYFIRPYIESDFLSAIANTIKN